MTEQGDRVRVTSHTGSARFVGDLKKVRELSTRRQTRRFDFWGSLRQDEFAPYGGQMNKTAQKIVSLLMSKPLTQSK